MSFARPCPLKPQTLLVTSDADPNNLVFLTSGLASLVVTMSDGRTCGVNMVGRESLIGASSLLGSGTSHPTCVMRTSGSGLQLPKPFLRRLLIDSPEFQEQILAAVQREINSTAQTSACNLRHQANARLASWLLNASDLMGSSVFSMEQKHIAEMLGTARTTISLLAQPLTSRGLISVSRGIIRIFDRPGLMEAACECYEKRRHFCLPAAVLAAATEPAFHETGFRPAA
ncbi:cAMP-binding protein [Terriglobus roseus DSM 18391]|uniref:cAMP-binding protein n=1 Tax=Terriglobus roseus (strain DSM 18391 / NRRL B-41598 / KBS 63) TaxID=926566 RepID=I3ZJ12_TERRK|nr:cAMP-binding protein [Terriglobus roseus DSM 18391]